MDRETVLAPAPCDLKRLPLGALEAFVLSQVDGRMTIEEIAEIAGLDVTTALDLVRRLEQLGAVSAVEASHRRRGAGKSKAPPRPKSVAAMRSVRIDPRAEQTSLRPPRNDSRAERSSMRPVRRDTPPARPSPRPPEKSVRTDSAGAAPRRASRSSLKMSKVSAVASKPPVDNETCDLDDAARERIEAFDARLAKDDHYVLLDVERAADKKTIKRAYFAFASRFHPDRFFGKKLGKVRAALDRVFKRVTDAHDVLTDPARRAAYDRTLPKAPSTGRSIPPRSSMAPRASVAPRKSLHPRTSVPPRSSQPPRRASKKTKAVSIEMPQIVPSLQHAPPPVIEHMPVSEDSRKRLQAAGQRLGIQRRVELFVQAAEEAMKVDDVIGAANNYRLALDTSDDPFIRQKLEDIDELAKTRRRELSLARAKAAERDKRWADAALHYGKANDARPAAPLAERAAHALWMSDGDLDTATALARSAISMDRKNAGYRVTLAEIHVANEAFAQAAEELEEALALDDGHKRARELASIVKKKQR